MEPEISLSCKDLVKTYPGVIAMDHINFELRKGEVHALLGENGAGKSTLIKSIAGAHQCDSGTITIDGKEFHGLTPLQAKEMGVEVVYQEFNQMPSLSVAENIYLTELRGKRIVADKTSDDNRIDSIVHLLCEVADQQRDCKKQDELCRIAYGHIFCHSA